MKKYFNICKMKLGFITLLAVMLGLAALPLAPSSISGAETVSAEAEGTVVVTLAPKAFLYVRSSDMTPPVGVGTGYPLRISGSINFVPVPPVFTDNDVYVTKLTYEQYYSTGGFHYWQVELSGITVTLGVFEYMSVYEPFFYPADTNATRTFLLGGADIYINFASSFTRFIPLAVTFNVTDSFFTEIPPDPLPPAHHTFAGWYFDAGFTKPYDGSPIFGYTDLYARFLPVIYTLSFVSGVTGLTIPAVPVTALTAVTTLPAPAVRGYMLTWYTDTDRTQEYIPILSMTGNITLYAGWEQIFLTVTFRVNGEIYASLSVPYGAALREALDALAASYGVIATSYFDEYHFFEADGGFQITSDTDIYAAIEEIPIVRAPFFKRAGAWLGRNWPYFPVSAGCFAGGMAAMVIILKKRGDF